jgi:arylsulfatase A
MAGRYVFRTGGIGNGSWRGDGPGAKSAYEPFITKVLKQGGYVMAQAGKWRQVGETPRDWGFDEYVTDPTAGGWFWKDSYEKNGEQVNTGKEVYNPDIVHAFSIDFITRNKEKPFFLYFAMHLVHGPILRTPDTKEGSDLYEDNIASTDKQVGGIVAEVEKLGLREKTLIIFSADNGTANSYTSAIGGRMISDKSQYARRRLPRALHRQLARRDACGRGEQRHHQHRRSAPHLRRTRRRQTARRCEDRRHQPRRANSWRKGHAA